MFYFSLLLFISIFQNVLVLAICFPAVAVMESTAAFGLTDIIGSILVLGFIVLETVADEQQMRFHTKKRQLLNEGKPADKIENILVGKVKKYYEDNKEAINKIMRQTILVKGYNMVDKMLSLIDNLLSSYNIYEISCDISDNAVIASYNALNGGTNNEN